MNRYKIADLIVETEGLSEAQLSKMTTYLEVAEEKANITMRVNRGILDKTSEEFPYLTSDEYEYIQTGYAFACKLLDFDGFCLHSSAVALRNRAILFSGPSGTGKSTHTGLWQQYFGKDKAVIINDDKPALRLIQDTFYVYGTPWSGKSHLHVNTRVPLAAIVFLKQANQNLIRRLDSREAVPMLIYQSLRPSEDLKKTDKLLGLLDTLLQKTPVYQLDCTISINAVKLSYEAIYEEKMQRE